MCITKEDELIAKEMSKNYEGFYDDVGKFIWGIKSRDDMTISTEANWLTLNDLDLYQNKEDNLYYLSIETIYMFKVPYQVKSYLYNLLQQFTDWMLKNNYNIDYQIDYDMWFHHSFSKGFDTIEQAYAYFKIWVMGYIDAGR